MHLLDFLTESQNTEVFVTLLKSDCTTDALTAISKILGAYTGNTCGGVSFRCSYTWSIGQLKFFKRNATKDVFLIIFQNFHNSSFSNIL